MKEYAIRLTKGADLKASIEEIVKKEGFNTAIVLSSVGSLSSLKVRLAGAKSYLETKEDFEIVSLNGTISCGKAHLHISCSDEIGFVTGGHLEEGCIVNTTVELVLGILEEYESLREKDDSTGFSEIVFRKKD